MPRACVTPDPLAYFTQLESQRPERIRPGERRAIAQLTTACNRLHSNLPDSSSERVCVGRMDGLVRLVSLTIHCVRNESVHAVSGKHRETQ